MFKPKVLLWTEENIKNAGDDVFFIHIEEIKDEESSEIGISIVDKNKKIIEGGNIIFIKQVQNTLLRIIKHNCINPIIPIPTDVRGEVIIYSETEVAEFRLHTKNIQTNEILKHLAESMLKKNQLSSDSDNVKH